MIKLIKSYDDKKPKKRKSLFGDHGLSTFGLIVLDL